MSPVNSKSQTDTHIQRGFYYGRFRCTQCRLRYRSHRNRRMDRITGLCAATRRARPRALFARPLGRRSAESLGVDIPFTANTPYINTIPCDKQLPYPGDREIERRIKSLVRWNAMAMVTRANKEADGIGGHISTFASAATLYEVGQNHFFKAPNSECSGDQVFFQGHASPGMYARAFLEGRLTTEHLENFRRELRNPGGLSSYPHPYLMPDFWQFPTVSMGLGPLVGIYQARFNRYLEDRGLKSTRDSKVWGLCGRRRNRRTRNPGRHQFGDPRTTRQPHFCDQLQFATPGRPGARQWQNHSRTRASFSRRRLECHQSDLGRRLGRASRTRHTGPCSNSAWKKW